MSNNASFLPEDYLDQKAEQRTNLISLVLFAVVMLGVFLAFLFTNEKRSEVKHDQEVINARYQQAAQQITELVELERQKGEMLQKAELAAALVERVPRSILLAELINRMPEKLSLLEFSLISKRIRPAIRANTDGNKRSGRLKSKRAKTKEQASREHKKIRPPRFDVSITLIGVAPTGIEVTHYLAELNAYSLLRSVTLESSEEKEIEGQLMQQFEIDITLDPDADVRDIEPLIVPREIDNPMTDRLRISAPRSREETTTMATPNGREGD